MSYKGECIPEGGGEQALDQGGEEDQRKGDPQHAVHNAGQLAGRGHGVNVAVA